MAERRTIAKKISVSEQVNSLSSDFTRLLFTWMIPHADDYGVLSGSAWSIRSLVIPMLDHTNAEVEAALAEMEKAELLWRYSGSDKKPYVQFRTWEVHQSGLHKRTQPHLPLFYDPRNGDTDAALVPEVHGDSSAAPSDTSTFREVPGSSRKFPEVPASRARRTETKRNEENRNEEKTPTVGDMPQADATEPPTGDSAPTARSTEAPASAEIADASAFSLPERIPSETERAYWERVMKELPGVQRIPMLVQLARDKIGLENAPPGGDAYKRLGALAKKHHASLVAVWIIQASGQHIAGDPLDYLTKLANGQIEREARSNGRYAPHAPYAANGRSAGGRYGSGSGNGRAGTSGASHPPVGTPEYVEWARARDAQLGIGVSGAASGPRTRATG